MRHARLWLLFLCLGGCTRQELTSRPSGSEATLTAPSTSSVATNANAGSNRAPGDAKPQSAAECQSRCNGQWGAHGLSGVVSCLCRTTDAGKDCRDRVECQGECLLADPPRTEVVAPGPPASGYFIGKCAEFVTSFGCARRIQAGTQSKGPVELSEPPPQICMD